MGRARPHGRRYISKSTAVQSFQIARLLSMPPLRASSPCLLSMPRLCFLYAPSSISPFLDPQRSRSILDVIAAYRVASTSALLIAAAQGRSSAKVTVRAREKARTRTSEGGRARHRGGAIASCIFAALRNALQVDEDEDEDEEDKEARTRRR